MNVSATLVLVLGSILTSGVPDGYDVVWQSPSEDWHGSMPLGNGDVCLNAWVQKDGGLEFFISKTDAWDDNARLVKVGRVRIALEPNPFAAGQPFRQTLSLDDATVEIEAGQGERATSVRLWVDANRPLVHVTLQSAAPLTATASAELWRTSRQELDELQVSDVLLDRSRPDNRHAAMFVEPDAVLTGQQGRIGWYHHNAKSVGPAICAEMQGLTGFRQQDPLLGRTFGAVITSPDARRIDDLHLESPSARSHRFTVCVLTRHPSTPDAWLAGVDDVLREAEAVDFAERRSAHEQWWSEFWDRSWIRAKTANDVEPPPDASLVPANEHPVRIASDQGGGSKLSAELGRVSIFNRPLDEAAVRTLAETTADEPLGRQPGLLYRGVAPGPLPDSADWDFAAGLTVEAWISLDPSARGGGRIVDKITPGKGDGFLFDTYPGRSLRLICGTTALSAKDVLAPGKWTHVAAVVDPRAGGCRMYVDGKPIAGDAGEAIDDQADYVSRMYHLQRFINACAGRGAYPIKFNGSLFTVPPAGRPYDPDYRRWGPGYWWQNTRLPYISMATSGDFDLIRPLFRMYADQLLELCKYRTRHYFGHGGAYYPECIYFWGPVFSDTYGWTPFDQRADKLQEAGWHKWEWVGGLELAWMMLDYYEHTLDEEFLHRTAIPFSREILTFFEEHYKTGDDGKLVMHPAQALETWWDCTDPMPELAGCIAVTERLLALPERLTVEADRQSWRRLREKLPELPLREVDGKLALAPAAKFAEKHNIENPELYAVFPFRLVALGRPHLDWGIEALEHRWNKGDFGWRQDDVFMAYLGLTEETRQAIVSRARRHDRNERFPAFWGPNYDWTPDQDHGGILLKTLQAMALQTDGKKIYLLPSWPKYWDVELKLHAPQATTIEARYVDGRLEDWSVTPESRAKDVVLPE